MDAEERSGLPAEVTSGATLPPLKRLPAMVKNELAGLTDDQQEAFAEEYYRKVRKSWIGYVLWFFLGLHYVYVKKWGVQFIFWVTVGGLLIWWIIDLFRIPRLVRDYNKDVAIDALRNLRAVTS